MRIIKKFNFLPVILTLILLIIVVSASFGGVQSYAANAETETSGLTYTKSSDNTYYSVTGYSGSSATVIIPETHSGLAVTAIDGAFKNNTTITSVTIPCSITYITANTFTGCSKLASVTFEISDDWFVASTAGATSGTTINSSYLANKATAATYLKTSYCTQYWYNVDKTVPTGSFFNSDATPISSEATYTNSAFYYAATDNNSGLSYMKYSTDGSNWEDYDGRTFTADDSDGIYYFYCVDNAGNQSETINMHLDIAHTYEEVGTGAETCEERAYTLFKCTVCGQTYKAYDNSSYPTGHEWIEQEGDGCYQAATCTEEGYRTYYCEYCGETETKTISALGHSWKFIESYTDDGAVWYSYECTRCGETKDECISTGSTSEILKIIDMYQIYMFYALAATVAIWSVVLGINIIIARKKEEQEKARKMVTVYIVGLVAIFFILVALPYIIEGIAALL